MDSYFAATRRSDLKCVPYPRSTALSMIYALAGIDSGTRRLRGRCDAPQWLIGTGSTLPLGISVFTPKEQ
jgi:hypothetical protein